jgi:CBS domain-containing protein
MLAKQVSKDKEIFCTAEMPLAEVFNKMRELNCACMPIVESPIHRNIIGTITEHDICVKIVGGGLNPQRASAGRVMNPDFTTVGGEKTLDECAEIMDRGSAERLFVVDENGAFMGVLTKQDFLIPEKSVVNGETVMTDFTIASALSTTIQLGH